MQPEKSLPTDKLAADKLAMGELATNESLINKRGPLRVVYITAGAAGMICGSCLHDNTLARALIRLGHDVQLIPLYTPLRTDEEDVAAEQVFFGGINVYLQQKSAVFRWLPRWLDRWLDNPRLIDLAAGRSVKIEPLQVADLAISVLRGSGGVLRKEVERLIDWLTEGERPDVVVLSNVLTAGWVPELKRRMKVPVVVTLQGDDIFLRGLPPEHEAKARELIHHLAGSIDLFLVNSHFYADAMAEYLKLDRQRFRIVPLGIETSDFETMDPEKRDTGRPPTVGYLARLTPEKGLDLLADAFIKLREKPGMAEARLRIAGWLGENHRRFVEQVFKRLETAGLAGSYEYWGEVDRGGKLNFLKSIDVLAVPTSYRDPKGLFALEALAAGVPVVLPGHGAFPELLQELGGGLLHRPLDAASVADRLYELLASEELRRELGTSGRQAVLSKRNAQQMAMRTLEVLFEATAEAK